jgi:hypothetical protein
MDWDMGIRGVALLLAISIGFGVVAQLVMWRAATHWLWLIAGTVYFVSGLLISEVWFGWATEDDLQPNVDGLSVDEAVWISFLPGLAVVFAAWMIGRRAAPRHNRSP